MVGRRAHGRAQRRVVDDFAPNLVTLRIVLESTGTSRLIDAAGDVHDTVAPASRVEENVYVRESESSPWKLRSVAELGPPPDADA